ncbi:hypothetical protein FE697_006815 [Mumia zhuanghuii]|uniref:4 TMS phage holin, superfamily IV n=2 Tax=Mumia TaxID=1546255 RepID=A0ABW1QKJ9_9ACTN|nr:MULTISPECIES: hypothetical protein [Mumia]KAA1423321.1 hypothetical protein FE697_006815 [Mumia zhuanghuii]
MLIRIVAALAVLVSAVVHLWLWVDGVKDQGVVGGAFLVNAFAGVVIAILLVTWMHWIPLFLTAGFGLSTFGAFLISATVGLFGVNTGWSWYAWVAAIVEVLAVVLAVVAALREGYLSRPGSEHGGSVGVADLH